VNSPTLGVLASALPPMSLNTWHLDASRLPAAFDVISTSNVADSVGIYNLLLSAQPLLRRRACSSIQCWHLASMTVDPRRLLKDKTGLDSGTAALLLGLLPDDWCVIRALQWVCVRDP
jgi:hypothetical protein